MNTVSRPNLTKDLKDFGNVHVQLSTPRLVEKILERKEGILTSTGAVRVMTGKYTGRSPKDKYIVEDSSVKDKIDWGAVNQPLPPSRFLNLYKKMVHYLKDKELFLFKGFAGSDPKYRLPIDVYTEFAWHSLFARQLFIRPDENELKHHEARFTLLFAPNFKADPLEDGLRSETFIIISFEHRLVLIGGTEYAGEMKKSIFTVMNYLLPEQGILSMHCSANVGDQGDVALFFGLSGTGKTTLSTDPRRKLIGDDEHGWSDEGIFNIEGGCYAKCIHLSEEKEPQIFRAIGFGSVLENVVVDPVTRVPDYDDASLTENTRAAYPIEAVKNIVKPSVAGLRRLAPRGETDQGAGHVPFFERVYEQAGRDGTGSDHARGHLFGLLRGPLPPAFAAQICGNVGKSDRQAPGGGFPRQYGVDRRRIRGRKTDQSAPYPGDCPCDLGTSAAGDRNGAGSDLRLAHPRIRPRCASRNPESEKTMGKRKRL